MRLSYGPFHLGKMAPGDIEEITGKVMKEQLTGFFGGDGSKAAAKRDNDNHGQAKAKPKKPKAHRKTPARSDSRGGPRDADTGSSLKSTGPRPFENDSRNGGYNDRAPAGRGRDNDRDDNRGFGRDDNARRGAPQNRSFGGGNDRGDRNDNDSRDGGYQGRSSGRGRDSQNRDNNTAGNRSFGGQGQPSGRGGNPRNRDDAGENRDNTSRPLNKGRGRYAGGNAGAGKPAGRPGGNTGSKPAGNRPAGRNGPKPAGNGKRGDR